MIKWLKKLLSTAPAAETSSTPESATSRTDTEFTAEVVRVARIEAHPNADKLELARFEMKGAGETAYEVVVQKGTYQAGDLAAYFSVDCILPLSHPDFAFLKSRMDGQNKDFFRLRAARLRKVLSQGLLTPITPTSPGGPFTFGQQLASLYGVTYHRDPEPSSALGSIDGKSPKLKFQPCPVYSVESLKKQPHLFAEGEPVFITEKIHGTNFRFGWVRRKLLGFPFGWRFVVGSHRVMKHGGKMSGHYYGHDLWGMTADKMQLAERTKKHRGLVFYGELYGYTYDGSRIQDLTYGCDPLKGPQLAVFDIRAISGDYWLDPWERGDICIDAGLPQVPVLHAHVQYEPDLASDFADNHGSTLDGKTVREGVVVEALTGPRRKAKYVSQAYLERKDPS